MHSTPSDTKQIHKSYWQIVWQQFRSHVTGISALGFIVFFILMGIYAPFFASSKPLFVIYDGTLYFPLFRYLFCASFYTKPLDIFFNLLIFTLPLFFLSSFFLKKWKLHLLVFCLLLQLSLFAFFSFGKIEDPASDPTLNYQRHLALQERKISKFEEWTFDLQYLSEYGKLNKILQYRRSKDQHQRFEKYAAVYKKNAERKWLLGALAKKRTELISEGDKNSELTDLKKLKSELLKSIPKEATIMPTLWAVRELNELGELQRHNDYLQKNRTVPPTEELLGIKAEKKYLEDRRAWLREESEKLSFLVMPLLRSFHWEDDAGGEQDLNQYVDWWELTRVNRKDMVAALLFGIRISLVVGIISVFLALIIGIPLGSIAGYYGGKIDIVLFRLLEIWESMPTLFMLLLIVAVMQTKSIFLVITVLGVFGWTGFCRFIRGETLKQRHLPYVDACRAIGLSDARIIFSHILPNAIPPLLTLLPFSIMGAITSEAGLSFLGLGEEGSCSWGVLMEEGRGAFPGESYLLWPPAILLTLFLVAIALVGDAMRDAFDPKMRS